MALIQFILEDQLLTDKEESQILGCDESKSPVSVLTLGYRSKESIIGSFRSPCRDKLLIDV